MSHDQLPALRKNRICLRNTRVAHSSSFSPQIATEPKGIRIVLISVKWPECLPVEEHMYPIVLGIRPLL